MGHGQKNQGMNSFSKSPSKPLPANLLWNISQHLNLATPGGIVVVQK